MEGYTASALSFGLPRSFAPMGMESLIAALDHWNGIYDGVRTHVGCFRLC